ncbi:MAG TPA: ABC transporter permease [Candidatus Atribacteria bacterium]|nr:ABC transporter permease [Candidatus Atribacteria bacterium]
MKNVKRTKLDKKMDIIKQKEEAGLLEDKSQNRALRRFFNNRLATIGLIIFTTIIFITIFAPIICKYSPQKIDLLNRLKPPTLEHIFGTDKIGRDVFARILYGGRVSIFVGIGSALGAAIIGVLIGSYAGYKGGLIDNIFMRISEIMMSFPRIVLVLLAVSIVGQSLWNLIVIFILTGWGSIYRMTRAKILSIREEEYVLALKAFGLNDIIICYKHMLPNALGPVLINITLSTAMFILQEAALSFLGLGVPLNIPTWGNILNVAQDISVLRENWWIWLPVGTVISIFVLSVNFIGDGLRDSLDPTQQG